MNVRHWKHRKKIYDAAEVDRHLAREAINIGDKQTAWKHMRRVLLQLSSQKMDTEGYALFINTSLDFSNLSFAVGQGFTDSITFLQKANDFAERIGDRRSHALISLHMGHLYYYSERRHEALTVFEEGKAEVERLGDEDIVNRAAEFIGLYYFIQGIYPEAESYFVRASQRFESCELNQGVVNPSGPMWLSYCAAYQGHFNRAIGTLDYYRRLASDRSDPSLATTFRAVLAVVLLMIKSKKQAYFHLSGALKEATGDMNALAIYFVKGGLAYYHFLEGDLNESRNWLEQAISHGAALGLIRQYGSPIFLELVYELHRQGMGPSPHVDYRQEVCRIMNGPDIHLRGVALRLQAQDAVAAGQNDNAVEEHLRCSEEYLVRTGDPIQLSKTWVEMARVRLRRGDNEGARILTQKAWRGFSGYGDIFFPDDLRYLLTIRSDVSAQESRGDFLDLFTDTIHELAPTTDFHELLARTVAATNRFFGAERGGIFWFNQSKRGKKFELRAACNLLQADVDADDFRANLSLVFKAYRDNAPQIVRQEDTRLWPYQVKAILCIPIEIQSRAQAVLYHDNSYVRDCFEYFEKVQMIRIARSFTRYIENIMNFSQRIEEKASASLSQLRLVEDDEILTEDPVLIRILEQADRIAATDSSVLILGETGVGKELLARRIHHKGSRRNNPFIIIDLTTVPESLVESELFGHERGAFTGADQQKIGRMELAHHGTVFIDEIGEIPRSVQVKLLRVIQEKALLRVGGTKPISSDFRLIVATNRDLAAEVAMGRFREDLYYRLNVIPFTLPPLRERKKDIPLLARHYLRHFSMKYNVKPIEITSGDEAKLMNYSWPGNVRELKNIMERAVLLQNEKFLQLDLPIKGKRSPEYSSMNSLKMDEIQRRHIVHVLQLTNGRIGGTGGAAEILGMKRTSLINRMIKLGMKC